MAVLRQNEEYNRYCSRSIESWTNAQVYECLKLAACMKCEADEEAVVSAPTSWKSGMLNMYKQCRIRSNSLKIFKVTMQRCRDIRSTPLQVSSIENLD